jgi:alpha,alpha-trehalase
MTDLVEGSHAARSTVGGSPFPPIADYGFLSDCEVSALVAPSGNVEWMCLPRMDGPSVFAAMLDRGAGWWGTPTGWAVVRDVLLVGPWRHGSARSETHQRAPVDHSAERVLLRTARCLQGTVDFVLECEPAFDYGRQRGSWRYTGDGYGEAEALAGTEPQFRLTTDLNVGFEGPRARCCCTPRRPIRIAGVTSGTSRKPSPTWRSSTRSST